MHYTSNISRAGEDWSSSNLISAVKLLKLCRPERVKMTSFYHKSWSKWIFLWGKNGERSVSDTRQVQTLGQGMWEIFIRNRLDQKWTAHISNNAPTTPSLIKLEYTTITNSNSQHALLAVKAILQRINKEWNRCQFHKWVMNEQSLHHHTWTCHFLNGLWFPNLCLGRGGFSEA